MLDNIDAEGGSHFEAVKTVDLDEYAGWLDAERIVVNLPAATANSTPPPHPIWTR